MGTTTKQTKGMGKVIPLRRRERDEVSDLETAIRNEVEKVKRAPESFADFEAAVHARFMAAEREVFAKALSELDERAEVVKLDGVVHRRAVEGRGTYMTIAGEVEVVRMLYRDRTDPDARAIPVLDRKVGIVEGFWTPAAAKLGGWAVSQMTPKSASELFKRTGNMTPSKASLDRLPKTLNEAWEGDRRALDTELQEAVVVPQGAASLAVSIDGVMAPMEGTSPVEKRAATASRGRLSMGPIGYREMGCASISFCDSKGEMMSAIRIGRSPEPNKAGLKALVTAYVAKIREKSPIALKIVNVADGGGDNFTFLRELCPGGHPHPWFSLVIDGTVGTTPTRDV